ncbi:MAG: winged helix-turn-helix transcriptional regulator [Archangiaceae bacterium]|nr:winged helix-turn-helix transcriptional regulator [Archangiaceae bacterium]
MLATFQALAEPNRLRIVELLLRGPRAVGAISEKLELRQPQVSKHLAVLKAAGLVEVEARANQRLYELRAAPLAQMHGWLMQYRQLWEERHRQMDEVLEDLKREQQRRSHPKPEQRHGRNKHR